MGKQICVQAGKTAGSCIRGVLSVGKVTGTLGQAIKRCADSTTGGTGRMFAKLGNLFKRISTDGKLAAWDEKQKNVYVQLGEQIFYGIEKKNKNILEQEDIKNLLKQAGETESHKQEIQEAITLQKRKMDEIVIFKQSKDNIQGKDPRMRRVAIRVLERLGDKKAIPLLTKALEDPDAEVRERAAQVLHGFVNNVKKSQVSDKTKMHEEQKVEKSKEEEKKHKKHSQEKKEEQK